MHTLENKTVRLRLTPQALTRLESIAEINASFGRHKSLGVRYYAFSGAMNAIGNISEAYLLRADTTDNRPGTALWYREMQAKIPAGFEITVTGDLPEKIGLCRVVAPLFSAPVNDQTVFPLHPRAIEHAPWTLRDYEGHLGSHVTAKNLGGSGGGNYPGTIQRGTDCIAVLDGMHYLIRAPWSDVGVSALKSLPGAKWLPAERAWRVKKRWHRLIGLALDEVDYWEQDRIAHLHELCRDLGLSMHSVTWAHELPDRRWQLALPEGHITPGLRDMLRSVSAEVNGRIAIIRQRYAPNLMLISRDIDTAFAAMAQAHSDEADRGAGLRQQQAAAAAVQRQENAEQHRLRAIFPEQQCPKIGDVITIRGQQRRVVSLGQVFGGERVQGLFGPVDTPRTRYAYTEAL